MISPSIFSAWIAVSAAEQGNMWLKNRQQKLQHNKQQYTNVPIHDGYGLNTIFNYVLPRD